MEWPSKTSIPKTNPITLIALLFVIMIRFSLQDNLIVSIPMNVVRIVILLLTYFVGLFLVSFVVDSAVGTE